MTTDTEIDVRRLRWQCRRGMLELDFLLERYLDRCYATASPDQKSAFRRLLTLQDPVLNEWLVTGSVEPDDLYRELVRRIRAL